MTGEFLRNTTGPTTRGDNTVVALSGSFSQEILDGLRRRFAALPAGRPSLWCRHILPAFVVTSKPIEQNHLTLAFPGLDYNSPKRFALQLLSSILGGGLLPAVPTGAGAPGAVLYHLLLWSGPRGTGVFCIYTALNKETEAKALATIRQVVGQLRREGPTSEELERAREQSKANVGHGSRSLPQSRMSHAGRSLLFSGEILTPEQIIAAYDSVTHEDVVALAQEIFRWDQVSLSAVGQVRTAEAYRALVLEA